MNPVAHPIADRAPHRAASRVVLAHVRKDVASLRMPLLAWVACVVVSLFAVVDRAYGSTGGLNLGYLGALCENVAIGLQYLLLLILIVLAIQEDSLVEADAFWRTRPISRLELLAAKAYLIGALLLVSVAVMMPLLHFPSFSWKQAVFLCALIAFAAATPNFTRLVVSFLGVGFGAGFLAAVLGHGNFTWASGERSHGVVWSLGDHLPFLQVGDHFLLKTFFLVGLLAVTVHQYLTSRAKLSLALLFAVTFVTGLLWGS